MHAADLAAVLRAPPVSGMKRPLDDIIHPRRTRSKLPRRRRIPCLPLIADTNHDNVARSAADDVAESSSSCLNSEISVSSSLANDTRRQTRSATRQDGCGWNSARSAADFRPVTRWFAKQQELRHLANAARRPEAEVRCGDASSEIVVSDVSGGVLAAEPKTEKPPEQSEISYVESICEATGEKSSKPVSIQDDEQAVAHVFTEVEMDLELACSEQLSNDSGGSFSSYSTCNNEMTLSEFEAELFDRNLSGFCSSSDLKLYSSDSGCESSETSSGASATPPYFSFFVELTRQFIPSAVLSDSKQIAVQREIDSSDEFVLMRFSEEEDEDSYQLLRNRERRERALRDFSEDYGLMVYGNLVMQQRLVMVNWIIESAKVIELHSETLFLAVSLLDRFLSRGCFKTERNLQLLGIACLTLATKLEENQPYNSIRQKSFTIDHNVYTRCEVVSMEWVLQEVLNFHCLHPTIHNFLWFYLKAARANDKVEEMARYLAVLALLDHERLNFWPSTVAAGLVILASLSANYDSACHIVMETHVRTKKDDLPECIQSLEWLVKYAC